MPRMTDDQLLTELLSEQVCARGVDRIEEGLTNTIFSGTSTRTISPIVGSIDRFQIIEQWNSCQPPRHIQPYFPGLSLAELIPTPKDIEMNELMLALEAMIKRVVQEQLAAQPVPDTPLINHTDFSAAMATWLSQNKPTLDLFIKEGVLDKPWFDDTVAVTVADKVGALPIPTANFVMDEPTKLSIRNFVIDDCRLQDHFEDLTYNRVRDMDFSVSVDR